ncbi:methyltransferase [Trinickia fusca]|uniref:Methyltransferase domain-containing protein n=1 Tax=Trinickia fusca TaxID=2419777 RepID=A0A494XK39_9BURK|nr:methyltransferase [Trinickia fusca]RKP51085.1 methyltransferase domain-containing protein [Trinickia fusca]
MEELSWNEWQSLCEAMNGYIKTQVLSTACDLGIFDVVERGVTLAALPASLGIDAHGCRILMLGLRQLGCVQVDGDGTVRNSPLARRCLRRESRHSMVPFIMLNDRIQHRACLHFTRALRERRNAGLDEFAGDAPTLYGRMAMSLDTERLFHEGMAAYTRLSPRMLDMKELRQVSMLLDVGGGDGSNAIRLCERFPSLRVCLVDLPSVLDKAKANVADHGLEQRITCVAADMFEDAWPPGCDGVLFSHVLEIFSPPKISLLYRKAKDYLKHVEDGRLFVWALMCDADEGGGLQAVKSSVYFMTVASGEGMAYPVGDHRRWLKEAGFTITAQYDARTIDHCALVAR